MILLLDNYDSFVHNLARYLRRLGAKTLVVRGDQIDWQGCRQLSPDAVVLSPGPRRPHEAGCSIDVIRHLDPEIPVLGVCLGHQAIAAALGGLIQPCAPRHGLASPVVHDGRGLFLGLQTTVNVGRYHSLAVDDATLPAELKVTARSQDDGVIMGIQHITRPVFGVQFHPESVLTEDGMQILKNFVAITGCKEVRHSQQDAAELCASTPRESTHGELAS